MNAEFHRQHPSGQTLYAVLWYRATYFNWSAEVFQTPASGTYSAAARAMTEDSLAGHAISSYRTAALDLAAVWNQLTPRDCVVRYYLQAGGSPDIDSDLLIGSEAVQLIAGRLAPRLDITLVSGHKKDLAPRVASFWLTVTADGEPVDCADLDDADLSCAVVVRREGDSADFLTAELEEPDDDGRYYVTFSTPDYTADRTYMIRVNIGSGTLIRDVPFYAAG